MGASIKQYLRKWSMMINGEPFIDSRDGHQFRVVFDIDVFPQNTLAMADIQIYNLAKTTTIEQRSDISFSAGYENQHDTIFIGEITNIFRERRGPDVITRLLCRAGHAYGGRGTISASWRSGAKLTEVIKAIVREWPRYLEIDESQFDDKDTFPAGYTVDGDIPTALDDLAVAFDFEWMQERGTVVVTRKDRERTTNVFEINQHTGMVGIPEVTRGRDGLGVNVTTRLNPFIRSSSRINVKSEFSTYSTGNVFIAEVAGDVSANGEYNVFRMRYIGDTHGDDWNLRIDGIRAGSRAQAAAKTGTGLVWGARVSQEFRAKVREIAAELRLDPDWLMSVMAWETGESFEPYEPNRADSGAVGLIQFMPSTAKDLGTSTQALARMSAVEQLDWVKKYYEPYASRIRNIGDAYMAVFLPEIGIGKPDDYVIIDRDINPTRYRLNSGLDRNQDGKITRGEAVERVLGKFKKGMKHMA